MNDNEEHDDGNAARSTALVGELTPAPSLAPISLPSTIQLRRSSRIDFDRSARRGVDMASEKVRIQHEIETCRRRIEELSSTMPRGKSVDFSLCPPVAGVRERELSFGWSPQGGRNLGPGFGATGWATEPVSGFTGQSLGQSCSPGGDNFGRSVSLGPCPSEMRPGRPMTVSSNGDRGCFPPGFRPRGISPRPPVATGPAGLSVGLAGARGSEGAIPSETQGGSIQQGQKGVGSRNEGNCGKSLPTIRLGTYDGSAPLETHLAKLENCADYYGWNAKDRLCHLKASLDGPAGQVLWQITMDATEAELVTLLRNRFGNVNQSERFRAELQSRRRQRGELSRTFIRIFVVC